MKHVIVSIAFLTALAPSVTAASKGAPNYHLIKTIPLTGDGGWDYLSVDSAAGRLYVTRATHVTVVDTATGAVAGEIPDLSGVHGVAIDPKTGHGFTSNGRSNTVTVFDTKTLKKLKDLPTEEGPDAIVFDPATERVLTFNGRARSATVIDAKSETVLGQIALPGRPEAPVSDGRGHIYDNIEDKNEIVEIDSRAMKVLNTWPIAPGEAASGLAMDTKRRRLFAVADNQKLIVMNADTGRVVATPPIGNGPDACEFDAKTGLIFCPGGEDGTMTIVHEDTPDAYTVVQTLTTQAGARTMALDPKTHHVFTATAKMAPATPGADQPRWRRNYVPGSFVVLEYGE